ncbi:Os12g0406000, partial [Oryza sativa Japonica Group]
SISVHLSSLALHTSLSLCAPSPPTPPPLHAPRHRCYRSSPSTPPWPTSLHVPSECPASPSPSTRRRAAIPSSSSLDGDEELGDGARDWGAALRQR